ncbi:MAG: hypothetical protein ABSA71_15440 [Desulfomonilia bacterium]|jgi:hypothetical protein
MDLIERQAKADQVKNRVFSILTVALAQVRNTVEESGLEMRDCGISVERYQAGDHSIFVDLRMKI